jgi:hypothetical protein
MFWHKINDNFFLDENDVGKLVCIKIKFKYSKNVITYDNCIIIGCTYKKSNIRPDEVFVLKDSGSIQSLNLNYNSKIEIKFVVQDKNTPQNKNKFVEKYKKFYK